MLDRIHALLDFWFGDIGLADLPTSDRTNFWFGENDMLRDKFVQEFAYEYEAAIQGRATQWAETPRGRLALIILLDQYTRFKHHNSANAFIYDKQAQQLSLDGLKEEVDHTLTLIERVFFYMPLVHSEDSNIQEQSIRLYQNLVSLSMTETTQVYQLFLAYAYAHFRVIKEFGRFPQRNSVLGRTSTAEEIAFLRSS
jgi:uncharacterized protein (DUF924 family)